MNKFGKVCTLFLMGVLLLFSRPVFAQSFTVETVQAEISAAAVPPELVKARMEKTVSVIGEQLLAGKTISDIQAGKAGYEKIIREVFDKVLVGYSVQNVDILPGEKTEVKVVLLPWAQVINSVDVEVNVEGMPPEVETLIRRDLVGIEQVFLHGLGGLPIAATDWTNGVLKRSLNEFMEQHLPEFRADFDIDPDTKTMVKIIVYPRLPVIRTIDLSMRSDTIPNFTLLNERALMEDRIHILIGVPVNFVARHETFFSQLFAESLDSTDTFKSLGIKTVVTLHTAEKMQIMSRSDAKRFKIRLQGWADIGRRKMDTDRKLMFRLHAGYNFSDEDEIFTWVDLYPQDVHYEWAIGYRRQLLPETDAHLRYDLRNKRLAAGIRQKLAPKWFLRYEYRWADQRGEAGLLYQMHDFLGMELVRDTKDNWLRVIGNF